jgi:hypothetical protein
VPDLLVAVETFSNPRIRHDWQGRSTTDFGEENRLILRSMID